MVVEGNEVRFRVTGKGGNAAQAKRNLRSAIEKVSARLGNTPTICTKCYIHPEVLNSYMEVNVVLEIKSQVESELRALSKI